MKTTRRFYTNEKTNEPNSIDQGKQTSRFLFRGEEKNNVSSFGFASEFDESTKLVGNVNIENKNEKEEVVDLKNEYVEYVSKFFFRI